MGDVVDEIVGHFLSFLLAVERIKGDKRDGESDDEEDYNQDDNAAHTFEHNAAYGREVDDQVVRRAYFLVVFQQEDKFAVEHFVGLGVLRFNNEL